MWSAKSIERKDAMWRKIEDRGSFQIGKSGVDV